jgi:hypothetical protein
MIVDTIRKAHPKGIPNGFLGMLICHIPVLRNRIEASIRVPRMFKSHA